MEIVALILGLLATAFYLLCYQQKKRSRILLLNIISRLLYITQYFLLGAFEGVALEIAGALAVVLAKLKNKPFIKKHIKPFIVMIDLMIIASGLVVYKNIFSLLPIIGVLFHTSAMWIDDEKWIRRVSLGGNPFWFVYNFICGAYGSCVGEVLSAISIITAMIRYDRKKKSANEMKNEMERKDVAKKFFTKGIVVAVFAILCCALWGSATPFIKTGYNLMIPLAEGQTARPVSSILLFAGVRFALAGFLTIVIYSIARRRFLVPKKENVGKILTVSAFQTVIQYIFFYIGLANTTGVKGTIESGSNAFFSLIVASLIFRQEKLTAKKLIACLVGFAGVVIINLNGLDFNMNFFGDGFVLLSSLAYGVSSALMKKFSNDEDPVVISGYQFLVGGIFLVAVGLLTGGNIAITTLPAAGVMIYLAFLSAIAYALWGVLLKHNPVSKVTIYTFMIPVFGVLLSSIMLTENSEVSIVNLIVTLLLISGGIFMLNYKKEKQG